MFIECLSITKKQANTATHILCSLKLIVGGTLIPCCTLFKGALESNNGSAKKGFGYGVCTLSCVCEN